MRSRKKRRRAGSSKRDALHRTGRGWTTIEIPEGIEMFQPKPGKYRLDIIPYEVGEGNPYADPGTWYYERTFFVHTRIGPNQQSFVCPSKTLGKPCPICKHADELADEADVDPEVVKALQPKERQLFLVYDHGQPDKGVQLWEVSYYLFGSLLDDLRHDADENETWITDFDDPDAGSTLKVSFREERLSRFSFVKAYHIDFRPRKNGLSEELLNHGIVLDDLLKVLDYKSLKSILLQEQAEDEDEEDEDEEPVPAGRRSRRKSAPPTPKKVEEESDVEDEGDAEDDEDEAPIPPKLRSKSSNTRSRAAKAEEDVDEDFDDDADADADADADVDAGEQEADSAEGEEDEDWIPW